jgi:hypothetical protein
MTHLWLLSAPCWKKIDDKKLRVKQTSTAYVFRIVTRTLQKRKVAAKRVLHQLSEEQKAACKRVAEELLWCYEAEGEQFLNRTVAIDETWIQDFEPQLKSQSSQWKHATSP